MDITSIDRIDIHLFNITIYYPLLDLILDSFPQENLKIFHIQFPSQYRIANVTALAKGINYQVPRCVRPPLPILISLGPKYSPQTVLLYDLQNSFKLTSVKSPIAQANICKRCFKPKANLQLVYTKYEKGKGKLLLKIEEISGGKAHTNTQKLI